MATVAITEDELDKTVVDADGNDLGIVTEVRNGTAHVSADPAVVEEMQTTLPQGGIDEHTYAVHDESIADITDDRIVLNIER